MIERRIATPTHGRYLVVPPATLGPAPVLVGFHGYAEGAEAQLERLRAIPGADRWRLVSIQGLHRFYQRRTNEVVAGWMTRQGREFVGCRQRTTRWRRRKRSAVWPSASRVVLAGFSGCRR